MSSTRTKGKRTHCNLPSNQHLSESEAVRCFGVSRLTLYRHRKRGELGFYRIVVRVVHAAGETLGWLMQERCYEFTEQERAVLRTAGVILFDAMRREG
jgi:hypothetical protein